MRVMIIIWLILFSIIITAKIEKLKNHECDTVIVTMPVIDTLMLSDYRCLIGGKWVTCDSDKMASEEAAKD